MNSRHMTRKSSMRPPTLQVYADPIEMPASEASRVAMLLAIDEADILSHVQLARIVSVDCSRRLPSPWPRCSAGAG